MDRMKTARNIAILMLIAAGVDFLPGGGRAANTFSAGLSVAFLGGLAYLLVRLYREHRVSLHGLGDQRRALLYGALAVGVLAVTARPRMWQSSVGEFVWFVLMGLVAYTLVALYRFTRTY
jgi:hypothetical protein